MASSRSVRRSPSSSRKKKKAASPSFVPEWMQSFIARRLVDTMALVVLCAGLFVVVSLLSYSPDDPSMNSVGLADDIQNWLGHSGAWFADMIIQPLGAGGLLMGFGLIVWAWRIQSRHILTPFALRVCALSVASILLSMGLAQVPSDWTPNPYLGGALGTLSWNFFSGLVGQWDGFLTYVYAPFFVLVAAGLFLFAAAVTRYEIAAFLGRLRSLALTTLMLIMNGIIAFRNWLHRYNNPDYQPEPLFEISWKMPTLPSLPERAPRPAKTASVEASAQRAKPAPTATPEKVDEPEASINMEQQSVATSSPSIPVVKPSSSDQGKVQKSASGQSALHFDAGEWELPSVNLLEAVPEQQQEDALSEEALRRNAQLLQNVLADFKIEGEIVSIHPGPVVTLYELEPAPGTKSSRVISLSDDIARSMSAISVRCAVVPGRNVIGIEIPNRSRQVVYMQELLTTRMFEKSKAHLPLILGKDIGGQPILADLAKMPHLLVAGTTGSGKSVAVNTMILSLLYRLPPEKCRMIMIDPKMLELSVYDDIPHLLSPVVTEPGKAVVALKWAVQEMENRYRAMSKVGVRNIEGYNARMREAIEKGEELTETVGTGFDETGAPTYEERPMDMTEVPYIVVIVDEFADLMLVAGKDVENAIQRLAQMARAAGIHLIMATQRPSVDVITGVVKANFPTRISFQVTSKIDSRTILGEGGAEQLLGMGDMLYMAPGGRITRVHGPFVSDDDVEKVVSFLKKQAKPAYLDSITDEEGDFAGSAVMDAMFGGAGGDGESGSVDELYDQAVAVVAREGKASTSFIQRHLQIGYNRAARIMEEMEKQGVVSPASATGKRTVFVQDFSDV